MGTLAALSRFRSAPVESGGLIRSLVLPARGLARGRHQLIGSVAEFAPQIQMAYKCVRQTLALVFLYSPASLALP